MMRLFAVITLGMLIELQMSVTAMPVAVPWNELGSHMDIKCASEYCSRQILDFMEDSDCRMNLGCIMECGFGNTSCITICGNTYENEVYDSFMKCLIDDHQCLELQSPTPSFRCSPPATNVKNFPLSQLTGKWYVVREYTKPDDCFNCHMIDFAPSKTSMNYTANEMIDIPTVGGPVKHRMVMQNIQQKDASNGGMLDYTNVALGLTSYENWQVVYYKEGGQFAVLYYCGHLSNDWYYEGSQVYSRTPVLAPADLAVVKNVVMSQLNRNLDEYCMSDQTNCQA